MAARLPRRDRLVAGGALALLALAAAVYTALGVGMEMSPIEMTAARGPGAGPDAMEGMAGMARMVMSPPVWTPTYAGLVFLMWWLMMVAMMTPAAAPTVLLFAALKRAAGSDPAGLATAGFVLGYLLVWAGFSAAAGGLQWALELRGLVSASTMALTSGLLGGAVLVAAGLYQLTPLKHACLTRCRNPAEFLSRRRRPGATGALRMGAEHGLWCLGCCWALMALLFVGGIMNLYWIVGLAVVVLVEKLVPGGERLSRALGVALAAAGVLVIAGASGAV